MASAIFDRLQQFWPLSLLKADDLKISRRLVRELSIPEVSKQFIFAIPENKSGSVVYILTVQNLSEASVSDVNHVVKRIQPDVVVAQISPAALPEIQAEEKLDANTNLFPTSPFDVLRRCFIDKIDKNHYENLASSLVMREIFGTGFHGHLLAAKRAAEEVDARFLLLESPYENTCAANSSISTVTENQNAASLLQGSNLLPRKITAIASPGSDSALRLDPMQHQMVKMVCKSLSSLSNADLALEFTSDNCQPKCNYEAPPFAKVIYSLLADLHNIYVDLPSIGRAMVNAQKLLTDVHEGEPVNMQLLAEVYSFRIAIEGLRIALNNAAHCPLDKLVNKDLDFGSLSTEEKSGALFTQALKNQTKKCKSVVAIVDAETLSTIRRHWSTSIPSEEASLADQCFISFYEEPNNYERMFLEYMDKRRFLADTPVVAVGAGATAFLGASSISKAMQASTFLKLVTHKLPAILNISFLHLQRSAAIGLSKILSSTKILAPGMASKASGFKATASVIKVRRITHTVIASAERTSLLAMRSAFYEIMRKRSIRPVRYAPWATFGFSMATCATLLSYGDGIECAAESASSASTIASWGRGLQSLHQASQEMEQANKTKLQETLQSLMYRLKKMKFQ